MGFSKEVFSGTVTFAYSLLCNTRENCAYLVNLWITLWDARAWMENRASSSAPQGKRWFLRLGTLFLHNAKSNLKMSVSDTNLLSPNQKLLLSQRCQNYFVTWRFFLEFHQYFMYGILLSLTYTYLWKWKHEADNRFRSSKARIWWFILHLYLTFSLLLNIILKSCSK